MVGKEDDPASNWEKGNFFRAINMLNLGVNTLGLHPTQDASRHQDYETFLVGNPNLNLYLKTCIVGGGGRSKKSPTLLRSSPGII